MSTDWEEKLPTRALGFKDEFADSAGLTHTGRVKLDSIPEIVFDCLPILLPRGWMNWLEICLFHSLLNRIFATKKTLKDCETALISDCWSVMILILSLNGISHGVSHKLDHGVSHVIQSMTAWSQNFLFFFKVEPAPENFCTGKYYRYQYRKNLLSIQSTRIGTRKICTGTGTGIFLPKVSTSPST